MWFGSTAFVFAHQWIIPIAAHDAAQHAQSAFEGFEPLSQEQPVTSCTRHQLILSPTGWDGDSHHLSKEPPPHLRGVRTALHDQTNTAFVGALSAADFFGGVVVSLRPKSIVPFGGVLKFGIFPKLAICSSIACQSN